MVICRYTNESINGEIVKRNYGPSVEDRNFLSFVRKNNKTEPYSLWHEEEQVTLILGQILVQSSCNQKGGFLREY